MKVNGGRPGEYFHCGPVFMKERRIFKCTLAFPDHGNALTSELRKIGELRRVRSQCPWYPCKWLRPVHKWSDAERQHDRTSLKSLTVLQGEIETAAIVRDVLNVTCLDVRDNSCLKPIPVGDEILDG